MIGWIVVENKYRWGTQPRWVMRSVDRETAKTFYTENGKVMKDAVSVSQLLTRTEASDLLDELQDAYAVELDRAEDARRVALEQRARLVQASRELIKGGAV